MQQFVNDGDTLARKKQVSDNNYGFALDDYDDSLAKSYR